MQAAYPTTRTEAFIEGFVNELKQRNFGFVSGLDVAKSFEVTTAQINRLSDYWNRLQLDVFMGDGGRYRYRRYSALRVDGLALYDVLPHQPYVQSKRVNPLNGDIERNFDPIEPDMLDEPALRKTLGMMTRTFDQLEGVSKPWIVRLHPYRIYANKKVPGKPAPEGLHRDGVDYVSSVMIRRENISGGETIVAKLNKEPFYKHRLQKPLDVITCVDDAVLHGVSEITPLDSNKPAWRDVLVVAFSRD